MTATIVKPTSVEFCDKCGARAKVRAFFFTGDLFFCLHHTHTLDIITQALDIQYIAEIE